MVEPIQGLANRSEKQRYPLPLVTSLHLLLQKCIYDRLRVSDPADFRPAAVMFLATLAKG